MPNASDSNDSKGVLEIRDSDGEGFDVATACFVMSPVASAVPASFLSAG